MSEHTRGWIRPFAARLAPHIKMAVAVMLGAVIAMAVMPRVIDGQAEGPQEPKPPRVEKVVRAESFELVDKEGRVVGLFKSHEETGVPMLAFYGRKNKEPQLGIALNNDDLPFMFLRDTQSRPRFTVGVRADGDVGIDLLNTSGSPQVLLRGGKGGGVGVVEGDASVLVGWDDKLETLAMTLTGEDRKSRIVAWTPRDGKPRLEMFDATGKRVFAGPTSPPIDEKRGAGSEE